MFGGHRVIWIELRGRDIAPALAPLFKAPPRDCAIVVEAGLLKKGSALRSAFEKMDKGVSIECYPDDRRGLAALIEAEARQAGLRIAPDVRDHLITFLGADRMTTRGEIAKLLLYVARQGRNHRRRYRGDRLRRRALGAGRCGRQRVFGRLCGDRRDGGSVFRRRRRSIGAAPGGCAPRDDPSPVAPRNGSRALARSRDAGALRQDAFPAARRVRETDRPLAHFEAWPALGFAADRVGKGAARRWNGRDHHDESTVGDRLKRSRRRFVDPPDRPGIGGGRGRRAVRSRGTSAEPRRSRRDGEL